jgi:hypothetical protein
MMPLGCVLITAFNLNNSPAMVLSNRLKDENSVSFPLMTFGATR